MSSVPPAVESAARTGIPVIHFPPELPVSERREEIARAIEQNQVVIVAGETGSGKTTQLPKICLALGRESIGHTQPRRIAARAIAERVAEELGDEVGGLVGYKVRFTDEVSKATRIKVMTDGILLNEIHRDRDLTAYDTIIIDEAHERSLTIDFLLGYLKRLLPRRPDLKVIVTSATIDPESFAKHFADAEGDPAPVVEVSGRTYPVEVRYRPLVADDEGDDDVDAAPAVDRDYLTGITDALDELGREKPGDVLVFLSGETEIRDAEDAVRGHLTRRGEAASTQVLPLYGRLSSADQHRVFGPVPAGIRRRIVLSTNVAETSLTVPGIRYVIDAGTARISRYSTRAKVQRLPIEAISQASAKQRSGRSGRTSDGIAIRLYSEDDFEKRPEFTEPEILRTNLAAVILQMISLGLGDIDAFPFLTPPDSRGVKDGLDLLAELGAVHDGRLTKTGRTLARLPIDPRFGRMLVESGRQDVVREVMVIVSGLTIQDPRERPLEKRARADQQHARFTDQTSDFLTLLNLWNHLEQKQKELGSSAFRRLCKAEYLNYLRIREWQDLYRQLRRTAKPLGLAPGDAKVDGDAIHKSLLSGLLSHIGLRDAAKKDYLGARNTRFLIFPGSVLAAKREGRAQPQAVMSAELVETSRLFARMNAAIDPAWAEPLAGDLVRRSYSEPHWEKRQGAAVVFEKVTLFGVPIVPKRRAQLSRIDAPLARELFIRHALVAGEWPSDTRDHAFDFQRANAKLRVELEKVEERTRRRDILLDDEAMVSFFEERIPAEVTDTRSFESWWRQERRTKGRLLTMRREDLVDDVEEAIVDEDAFPPVWRQGDQRLALSYRFVPGDEDDGVTVQVPLALLPRLSPIGFDAQVPGLRVELITAFIRTLPKALRRSVVPAADWAARIAAELPAGIGSGAGAETGASGAGASGPRAGELEPFTGILSRTIRRLTSTPVDPSDFDVERVPPHLRMTFRVVDERSKVVATGKDLLELQRRLAPKVRESVAKASVRRRDPIERTGLTTWDFDELPRFVDTEQGGRGTGMPRSVIRGYPTLVPEKDGVAIRVVGTQQEQERSLPDGVRALLLNGIPSPTAYVQQHLTSAEKLALAASPYPSTTALFDDCLAAVVGSVLFEAAPGGLVFTRAEFEAIRDSVSAGVMDALFTTVSLVARVLTEQRAAEKTISGTSSMALLGALTDAKAQLAGLVFPGFVSRTGLAQLRQLPRYLQALTWRIERLPDNPGRDRVWMTEVQTATARFTDAGGIIPLPVHAAPKLVHARWMLEELRVSLFAQQLGTAETVSLQRIQKVLNP
ncbi:ATP-dependent RNA helicase HrpA [Humibacter ginsenosidimutans]|uniref:ATP-dependent RNA helicase HrpA n=1 Tax=Humibacter ginsenosidimutans TaxID=2599293 RepID=A0A5B8M167_9MICO|nr:ATP-dependent RNA helicase HrpA [Humibacter ginsenosidimutans]QDZ14558.1 ATP-dependent RNA helicase HrpA [Humibacter ginsenosidimutans]